MALKNYNVTVNGTATVLQLNEQDAKARGLTDKDLVDAESSSAPDPDKKAATPANKSRTAANKEQ